MSSKVDRQVLYEKKSGYAIITLNCPETLNSLTFERWQRVVDLISDANSDVSIGAIILTGSGRAFCSGGDFEENFLPKATGEEPYIEDDKFLGGLGLPFDWITIVRESKPLIAAVNGVAVGGGVSSILPFDIIVASEKADFRFMFVKLGITPEMGSSHYLEARVGFTRASELILTGRTVSATEAQEIGLINEVVSHNRVVERAEEIAQSIVSNSIEALIRAKDLITKNGCENRTSEIWKRETSHLRKCFDSNYHKSAVQAFINHSDKTTV